VVGLSRSGLFILLIAMSSWAQQPDEGSLRSPESVASGQKLFASACSACHGKTGEGGRGPNLADGVLVRRSKDERLFSSIKNGVPGSDMPGFPIGDAKIWQLVGYLRSLSAPAAEALAPGDPEHGRALFAGKGKCSGCHMIHGEGGFPGPDLTNAGATLTLKQLRESIVSPNARIAEGFQHVIATTIDGKTIEGVAKNRNNYSLQVLDRTGRLHLLTSAELRKSDFPADSLMPSARLTPSELQDLIAYVSRQSGRSAESPIPPQAIGGGHAGFEDIVAGPGKNWLTYHGDYGAQRHSPLKQITRANAASMVPKWTYHVEGATRLEAVPLVVDGVMYITNSNEVHALDARTGRRIWKYHDNQSTLQRVNRGVALLGDRVFFVTGDCHLIALQRTTGALLWKVQYADSSKQYFGTLAPVALKDSVVVGVGGGERGIRGFVAAFSPVTGKELWRFWTVPRKGEPGSETWGDFNTDWGGGATWMGGTYDPDLNLLYWPTGNPWPDFYAGERRGDNLYSCSVVALDASTGKLKWHFQFTPGDYRDWDAQSIPVLIDAEYRGRMRKLLLHPNRNGFFYVLDRTTGEFLSATPFVDKLNWATGMDKNGRPIEVPNLIPNANGTRICPAVRGASNWMSPSWNPEAGLLYFPALEQCDSVSATSAKAETLVGFAGGGGEQIPSEPGRFFLRAVDYKTGKRVWEYPMTGPATMWAGTVSTAGGLVFFGDDDGNLVAVDSGTGKHLWHYATGQRITASPMTFEADGRQYVSISAGTDVYTFGLFEPVKP
jgi:PQQ-dependent dehydrogenase (methanol/ethanol family)